MAHNTSHSPDPPSELTDLLADGATIVVRRKCGACRGTGQMHRYDAGGAAMGECEVCEATGTREDELAVEELLAAIVNAQAKPSVLAEDVRPVIERMQKLVDRAASMAEAKLAAREFVAAQEALRAATEAAETIRSLAASVGPETA